MSDDADDQAVSNYEIQWEADEKQMEMHVISFDHTGEVDRTGFKRREKWSPLAQLIKAIQKIFIVIFFLYFLNISIQ